MESSFCFFGLLQNVGQWEKKNGVGGVSEAHEGEAH